MLGFPDQALSLVREASDLAKTLNHPLSLIESTIETELGMPKLTSPFGTPPDCRTLSRQTSMLAQISRACFSSICPDSVSATPLRGPLDQRDAQLAFHLYHMMRKGRLGDVKPGGRSRKRALFCDRDEILELLDVHGLTRELEQLQTACQRSLNFTTTHSRRRTNQG